MKVAFLPVYANPYQRLLAEGLASQGVVVEMLDGLPSAAWLRARRGDVDILHYHWLYGLYMARYDTSRRTVAFLSRLRLARALGYRIVWTAHNILPHAVGYQAALRPLHVALRRRMMRAADAVIIHCEAGRRELLARFPRRGPTHVISIGSYAGVYPLTLTRAAARAALGLDADQFVYLFLGNVAAYKGLERFVEVFQRRAGAGDVALIAGRNRDAALVRRLERAAAGDSRIRLWAQFIPDDEMQRFLLAADVMVAPFERVLTSSSVMVGLSYGLPVIAPDLGCLPELIPLDAGMLYPATDPDALGSALIDIKNSDILAMSAAARRVVDGLRWEDIGGQTADVYRACLGKGV
ncbi:glycosyltransferase family 4 protein, partial [Promineifilum sp.]|uniref:glycosyltransferase family 4 protein n=1 Tax=Promineifilum sp. TaxID=2664178 RepID=UPI0035B074BD